MAEGKRESERQREREKDRLQMTVFDKGNLMSKIIFIHSHSLQLDSLLCVAHTVFFIFEYQSVLFCATEKRRKNQTIQVIWQFLIIFKETKRRGWKQIDIATIGLFFVALLVYHSFIAHILSFRVADKI